eukprot:4606561-Alexandrium_andersonii.AAC.1
MARARLLHAVFAAGICSLERGCSKCPRRQALDERKRSGPPLRGGAVGRLSWSLGCLAQRAARPGPRPSAAGPP